MVEKLLFKKMVPQRLFNPFTTKSDQFQISPAASPEISHSMESLSFRSLLRWKMITPSTLTTSPIHFSLKDWENVRFELMGVEGLKQ